MWQSSFAKCKTITKLYKKSVHHLRPDRLSAQQCIEIFTNAVFVTKLKHALFSTSYNSLHTKSFPALTLKGSNVGNA